MPAETVGFWQHHGLFFLIFITLFPRLTMFFAAPPIGCLAWVGWVFVPRLLVAILATTYYWHTNPVLCVIAWMIAFGGTGGEGRAVTNVVVRRRRRRD